MQGIDTRSQANVAWMEHQILDHVKDALRVTLGWDVPDVGWARKLSSVQFTFKSFQRHLERVMNIEELDGYLSQVAEQKPHLAARVAKLEDDHGHFRRVMSYLLPAMDSLNEYLRDDFEDLCREMEALLNDVDQHDAEEIALLQETMLCDEGGEG